MQELISYFYKGIFTHPIFIEFILYFNLITRLVESLNYYTFVSSLHNGVKKSYNTKGPARRPVLLRIVCSLLYEVYHDELERVHLVLGLTVSSGKRCAPVFMSFEELSRFL